jgi:hypothetical protein
MAFILGTIRRYEQYLLSKRIARDLSHRLGALALHYWGMSLTLQSCMLARGAAPRVCRSHEVSRKPRC